MSDGFQRILDDAKSASIVLARTGTSEKNAALDAIATALVANTDRIVEANAGDYARSEADGMESGLLDRLRLTSERVAALASAVRDIATLPDPVGEVVRGSTLPNGLQLTQVRVPFGVVGAIYEARPNVTADAAAEIAERRARLAKVQRLMQEAGIGALLVEPGSSLVYFTGVQWWRSERLTAALIPADGNITIVTPFFEAPSIRESLAIAADIRTWNEIGRAHV